MTKKFCDKCKKEITNTPPQWYIHDVAVLVALYRVDMFKRVPNRSGLEHDTFELCKECYHNILKQIHGGE
jgi:hypothetical protein